MERPERYCAKDEEDGKTVMKNEERKEEEKREDEDNETNKGSRMNRLANSAKVNLSKIFSGAQKGEGFIGLIQDNTITLKNLVIGLTTFGLERLTNSEIFDCPMDDHKRYGNSFLFFPVFILFCANLLIIGEIWKLSGRCYILRYRRHGDVFARLIPTGIVKALVGPAVWLIACFGNAGYYLCATVGPDITKRNLTDPEEIKDLEETFAARRSESHVIAWVVFGLTVLLGTIVIVCKNCFLKDYLLLNNLYIYERREAAAAVRTFVKMMKGEQIDGEKSEDEDKKNLVHFGDEDEFKIYEYGIPEKAGEETVKKIFEQREDEKWHYITAYMKFREKYPRAATGSPLDPWRVVHRDEEDSGSHGMFQWCYPQIDGKRAGKELRFLELEPILTPPSPTITVSTRSEQTE